MREIFLSGIISLDFDLRLPEIAPRYRKDIGKQQCSTKNQDRSYPVDDGK